MSVEAGGERTGRRAEGPRRAPRAGRLSITALAQRARGLVLSVPTRGGWLLFVVIVGFAVLGGLYHAGAPLALFDPDGEGKPPAIFSAALLVTAGAACALVSDTAAERHHRRRWLALAAFLAFMGVDEGVTIHEHLEEWTGIGWIKLYIPLIVVGGAAWLGVLRRMWTLKTERALFIAGAVCWGVAQVLEKIQATDVGRVRGYEVMSTVEEALEASGSALFLLAVVGTLQFIEGPPPAADEAARHRGRLRPPADGASSPRAKVP